MQLHSNLIRKLWLTPKPCQYNQKFIRKIPVLDNVCSDQLSSILFLMGVGLNSIILLTRFRIVYLFTWRGLRNNHMCFISFGYSSILPWPFFDWISLYDTWAKLVVQVNSRVKHDMFTHIFYKNYEVKILKY